jgi:hypothetical protein
VSRLPSQRVAGFDAAGLRIVPNSSLTTIGAVDIWADPATGLPLQVEIFGRGSATPVLVTRFLDLSLARPALATVTPSPDSAVGFGTTSLPDVSRVLNAFGPTLPGELEGQKQVANPSTLTDLAAYGSGFARFVVLPLPFSIGSDALTKASSVGAAIKMPGATAVLVTTPLLTVVLAGAPGNPVFLLTGAVPPSLLERAAEQLVSST